MVNKDLEKYFSPFRDNIIGQNLMYPFDGRNRKLIYADWAASGRMYQPVENFITHSIGPFVANTHTETTLTGNVMTDLYHQSKNIFKKHVNAGENDVILFAGFGMTAAVNKLQRILGLRVYEGYRNIVMPVQKQKRVLVILTHMEHHSNQTSWLECLCDVEIIKRAEDGTPDLTHLEELLISNKERERIIGSFTACSNVTGIVTPYYEMAELMHKYNRLCFVDFAGSAPYVNIDMHPEKEAQKLDAIFFSPHKFLGGPGSSGVTIFNKSLYFNSIPDNPGGGTVKWTNPWGGRQYFNDIEIREDGGTLGFLQAIKGAIAVLLKEKMGVENILAREHELIKHLFNGLQKIENLKVLEIENQNRIGFISFYVPGIHHNLIVRLLSDKYGIQSRGGCSCAGTYGHILFNIDRVESGRITSMIDNGDLSEKPGWVRISLHPTMQNWEIDYIINALENIINDHVRLSDNYRFIEGKGDFVPLSENEFSIQLSDLGI